MGLHVTGKLLISDGEKLRISIRVVDATGKVWINKTYQDTASKFSYEVIKEDPFQDLYNEIANDILLVRQKNAPDRIREIKMVADLRFALDLAPDAFEGYISEDKTRLIPMQLPAEDDTMMRRLEKIKEREYIFVDTMDEYYGRFYTNMRESYDEWRLAT